jgi:RND family efflux transporter MFP subunit
VLRRVIAAAVVAGTALLGGCGEDGPPAAPSRPTSTVARATPVTVATAERREVAVTLHSMGTLASVTAPTVSAEVDGRIVRLGAEAGERVPAGGVLAELDTTELGLEREAASADFRSLQAQIENEQRRVARFESLKQQDYLAQTQLDDSRAELEVLRAQTAAAQARLAIVEDKLARTTVRAPVAGTVERRRVSVGDFVRRGDPMFDLTADADLQALLPFPETVSQVLRPGLAVTLASPIAPGITVSGRVAELRPVVGRGSRAVTAIVPLRNPGPWRDQATVEAEVVVERRPDAVVVPAGAVVRRPAGEVVYRVEEGRAAQRPVTLGVRVGDAVEVRAGLTGGEVVAVEGASYLTDGAPVQITGPRP